MIAQHNFALRLAGAIGRLGRTLGLTLLLVAGLAGCRHKQPAFAIPRGAQAPVALEDSPSPDPPPTIETLPEPEMAPLSESPMPVPVPRKRSTPAPKEETQPAAPVAEAEPALLAIGNLSTGGDVTPEVQQQAQEMITSILKRITALSSRTAQSQKTQIRQIRHFLDQAQQALNSGDAEGAKNLATKARLLMDDLEKK